MPPQLEPDETTEVVARLHWLKWAPALVIGTIWVFIPLFLFSALYGEGEIGVAILSILFVTGAWFLARHWFIYRGTNLTVTNERLIWEVSHGLFKRGEDDVWLSQIAKVGVRQKGIIQRLFRFGDIRVSLKGSKEHIVMHGIPSPKTVQGKILSLIRDTLHAANNENS